MIANALKKSSGINYPGLIAAWSAKGKTNDDEDRDILRDLTGNGHDITLNGFAFSEMSGYNGYNTNFKNWKVYGNNESYYQTEIISGIKIKSRIGGGGGYALLNMFNQQTIYNVIHLKIEGLERNNASFNFGRGNDYYFPEHKQVDGVYEIDINKFLIDHNISNGEAGFKIFDRSSNSIIRDADIFIELLPEYPDALVFDGVDDYGINESMPILTDYTVIVNRRYIETEKNSCLISKAAGVGKGAFIMELIQGNSNKIYNYSFNDFGISKLYTSTGISWLNTTSYNGIRVGKGDGIDTNSIFMGAPRKGDNRRFKGAFYSAYLFDRSLDEQEIKEFIRKYIDPEYLLPSEQTTE